MVTTVVTEDMASCYRTYGLIPDCIVGNACRFCWMADGYRHTDRREEKLLAGRKGTFDGRYGCRKCFSVTFDKSNKTALTGMNTIYVPYPALFRECEVKK